MKYSALKISSPRLTLAIRPYLEDRKAYWQFVYNSPSAESPGAATSSSESSQPTEASVHDQAKIGLDHRSVSLATDHQRPRRTPDLDSSRERLALVVTLARELAIVKQELKAYCTVEGLKRKHPKFTLWTLIEDSQIKDLVDGEAFTPKAYAENLTLIKFGLTSRETLKKDRRKLRKAKHAHGCLLPVGCL